MRQFIQDVRIRVALVLIASTLAVALNHASVQLGRYSADSVQQQESIERGRLSVIGPAVADVDFDGSVVAPLGFGNDVRTFFIDVVLILQAVALVALIRQKNK